MDEAQKLITVEHSAPIIFFDAVLNSGCYRNLANIPLICAAHRLKPDGSIETRQVVVADLRCTVDGLVALRKAIDAALLLAMPAQGGDAPPKSN